MGEEFEHWRNRIDVLERQVRRGRRMTSAVVLGIATLAGGA
jgi:hypothetical protein